MSYKDYLPKKYNPNVNGLGISSAKIEKVAPLKEEETRIKKYGEGYSAESIKKQAEMTKFQGGDNATTGFLVGAVLDGAISQKEAEDIYGSIPGTAGKLLSAGNLSSAEKYHNTVNDIRKNGVPSWMGELSEKTYGNYTAEEATKKLEELDSKESLTPQERQDFNYLLTKAPAETVKYYRDKSAGKTNDLKIKATKTENNWEEIYLRDMSYDYPEAITPNYDKKGNAVSYNIDADKLKTQYGLSNEEIENIIYYNENLGLSPAERKLKAEYARTDYIVAVRDDRKKQNIYEEVKYEEEIEARIDEAKVDKDFEKYSVNDETVEDEMYKYFNGYNEFEEGVTVIDCLPGLSDIIKPGGNLLALGAQLEDLPYNYSTDEERKTFNFLYKKEKEKALEFAEKLKPTLNKRMAIDIMGQIAAAAKEHPGTASLGRIMLNLAGILPGFGEFVKSWFTEEGLDPYSPMLLPNYSAETIQSTVAEEIDSSVGRFCYNTGMSMADSLAVMPFGWGGAVLLGMNAAVSEGRKTALEGGSKAEIISKGLAAGIFEFVFEKLSIEKLFSPKAVGSLKDGIITVLKQGGFEASEELATSIANIITDNVVMGGESQFNKLVEQYTLEGLSLSEAQSKAFMEMVGEVGIETLSGFVSGLFFGTAGANVSYIQAKGMGNAIDSYGNTQSVIDYGLRQGEDTAAFKRASELSGKETVKNAEVGALLQQMIIDKQITKAEAERLVSEGLDGAPLSEGEQAYFYAGASGLSVTEAAELNSYLDVDPERAISAWQKGAEKRDGKPKIKVDRSTIEDAVIKNEVKRQADSVPGAKAGIKTGAKTGSYTPENKKSSETISEAKELKDKNYRVAAEKYRTEENGKEFDLAYSLGLTGEEITGLSLKNISDDARIAAYFAGRHDASSLAEKRRAFEGRRPGVSQDGVTAAILSRYSKRTREVIDAIGKKLGVEIRLVARSSDRKNPNDSLYNYSKGVVEININEKHKNLKGDKLIRFIVTHEAIHRIMETSPKTYKEMEKIALSKSETTIEEKMAEYECSREEAIEEIVCDYFGDLLSSKSEIRTLMNEHRNVFDVIYETIEWLCNKLRGTGFAFSEMAEARKLFREALSEADSNVWGKEVRSEGEAVRSENKWSKGKLDRKKQSYYNEYLTNAMKWARATDRKPGDLKILSVNGRGWALLEATEDGYVELYKGNYKGVKAKYEQAYRNATDEVYGNLKGIKAHQRRDIWDMQYVENGRDDVGDGGQIGSQELQNNSSGNDEHLRRGNKGESIDIKRSKSDNWRPNLTKTQLDKLMKRIDNDIETSVNHITETANWLMTRMDGMSIFAIYSTENTTHPTLLYESKGNQAVIERELLLELLEELENGENNVGTDSRFDEIFGINGVQKKFGSTNSTNGPSNGRSNSGNGRVLQKTSPKFNGTAAFGSVLKNLFEVSDARRRDGSGGDIKRSKSDNWTGKGLSNDKKTDYNGNGEQYRVMWTLEEGILDRSEVARLYEAMGEVKRGTEFPETPAGEYILDLYDKIAIVGGSYNYPEVTRVITFDIEDSYLRAIAMEEVIQYGMETTESDIWLPIIEAMYGQGNVAIRDYRDSKAFGREIGRRNGITGQRNSRGTGSGGDIKRSKSDKRESKATKKDPKKLTENEFKELLGLVKDRTFKDGSYIPARINTPQILIEFAREMGFVLENYPLAMNVYKARQAISNEAEWDGDFRDRAHDLTYEEVVDIIKGMDNPSYLVYQSNNDRFAEIVKFEKGEGKEKAYAIIDFFDVDKNTEVMNGYEGGKYNILVTIYPAEDSSELKGYLNNKNNVVRSTEEMKKKGLSQRGLGSFVPAHLNDSPFFNDSIMDSDEKVKEESLDIKRSKSATEEKKVKYFPPGEEPRRDILVPSEIDGEKVRQFTRTAAEAPPIPDDMAEDVVKEIQNGRFFYQQSSNAALIEKAQFMVDSDVIAAEKHWAAVAGGRKIADEEDIAIGEALLVKAAYEKDTERAMELISEIAIEGTRAGRIVQAMRLLKRMTPEGQLYYLQKVIERVNAERVKQGKKADEALMMENRVKRALKTFNEAKMKEREQEKAVIELEKAIEEATAELSKEVKIAELSEILKDLRVQLSNTKAQARRKNADSGKISEQIEILKQQIAEQSEELEKALIERDAFYREKREKGSELSEVRHGLGKAEGATKRLLGQIEIIEHQLSEAKEKYEKAKEFKEKLKKDKSRLATERNSLISRTESLKRASEKDLSKISKLNDEIAELSERLEVAEKAAIEAATVRRELVSERDRLKSLLKETENKFIRENDKITKLKDEIASLINDLYQADKRLETARKEKDVARLIYEKAREFARIAASKAGKVELPTEIQKAILESESQEELRENVDFATDYIAANMTATWKEKVKAWRYTMMLGNIRTQGRNFIGNAIMLLPTMTKNVIATPLEFITVSGYNKLLESKGEKMLKEGYTQEEVNQYIEENRAYRTKTITFLKKKSEEIRNFADESWEENSKLAMQGAKYDDVKDGINEKRRIFKSDVFENYRKATSWAMEKGDEIFLKINYKQAITSFMLSNKLTPDTITEAQKLRAEQYAIKEAREATFRDKSKIAEALNKVKGVNWATELFLGGLIPFTTTPINVTKRAFEYSPLGIIKVASDIVNFKGGKVEINEVVNSLAKLMTGSALTYLGFVLAEKGLLRAVGDDDDEEYDYLIGEQDYALKIGDYRYTIEWASPSAIPLLLGGAIWQSFFGKKGGMRESYFIDENGALLLNTSYMKAGDVMNSAINLFSPIFDATYLSGLSDALEAGGSFSSNPGEAVTAFLLESVLSFGGQFIPTWLGQLARTIDSSERRNNDYDRTNPLPYQAQKGIARIKNKIPFLNQTSTPYVNAWGEEEIKQGAIDYILSGVENFISPGFIEKVSDDELTSELWRLENTEAAKDKKIFPEAVPYSFTEDEKEYTFNPEQHNEYQKVTGQTARELIGEFVDSDIYGDLSDEERAEAVNLLWKYANAEGVKAVYSDYQSKDSNVVKLNFAKDNVDIAPVDYALWKIAAQKADYFGEGDRKGYGNGSINQDEADQALGIFADMTDSDIKEVALAYLWQMQTDGVSKNNPYGYALKGTPWYRANGKDYNNKLWMNPKE